MRDHDARDCVLCWQNRRGRTNYRGHWGYRAPRRAYQHPLWEIAKMKKPHAGEGATSEVLQLGEVSSLFPRIVEHLTESLWDDGSQRELSTLMIFADGARWKLCLNDRDQGRVAFMTGGDPEEALTRLEEGLATDSLDWRSVGKKNRTPGRS